MEKLAEEVKEANGQDVNGKKPVQAKASMRRAFLIDEAATKKYDVVT